MRFREVTQHTDIDKIIILSLLLTDFFSISYLLQQYNSSFNIHFICIVILSTYLSKGYNPNPISSRLDEIKRLFISFSVIWLIITFFMLFVGEMSFNQFDLLLRISLYAFVLIAVVRLLFRFIQKWLLKYKIGLRKVIVIGNNESAYNLITMLNNNPSLGHLVIGYSGNENNQRIDLTVKYIGDLKAINQFVINKKIHDVIISSPNNSNENLLEIIGFLYDLSVNVKIVPGIYEALSGKVKMSKLHGLALIDVNPHILTEYQKIIKRNLEVLISLLSFILMIPIIIIIISGIKATSKGTIFYKQIRVGRDGKEFKLYKFRTMFENSELDSGPVWASVDDTRITQIGRFLRRFRIDEIPQLLNVLKGDMSIVGPRPERPFFVKKLTARFPYYSRRLCLRPGITGWAQVIGDYDTTVENVENKLKHDFYYIENISMLLDLKIMLMTLIILGKGRGR